MYSIYTKKTGMAFRLYQKLLLVMRLTTVILIASIMQVSAVTFGQRINMYEKNKPLKTVLRELTRQSGYGFFYDGKLIAEHQKVSVNLSNVEFDEALKRVFSGLDLNYEIDGKIVSIKKKEESSLLDRLISVFAKSDIRGKVTNENGEPMGGAIVKIEKENSPTKTGLTNEKGEFLFPALEEGKYTITVSYLGYVTQNLPVVLSGSNVSLNFKMIFNTNDLQVVNIVNTGYQKISAEKVTGAFDNVNRNQLQKPAKNIAERLIGVVAGMQIKTDANGNPTIQVRGQTTLTGNFLGAGNTPLIVVDGFAITGTEVNSAIQPFGNINPNDVEDITVLKDAAAASIWGARSSNGVIVITTKRGSKNSPLSINFSANTRLAKKQDVSYITGLAGSAETVDFEQLAFNKWGANPNNGTIFSNSITSQATVIMNEHYLGYLTEDQRNAGLAQLKTQDNRGQISDYLLENPVTTQFNLSLSGGSRKMNNYLSLMAEHSQSNFKKSYDDKYALNYRTNANLFKWLDFELSGTFQLYKPTANGVQLYDIQQLSPYQLLKNPDGTLTNISKYYQPTMNRLVPLAKFPYSFDYNPIQEIENRSITNNNILGRLQAGLTFKVLPGLTFDSKVQYENIRNEARRYENDRTYAVRNVVNTSSTWDRTPTGPVTRNMPLGGALNQTFSNIETYNFRNQLNFSRTFADKHEINVLVGNEVNNTTTKTTVSAPTYGYDDQTLTVGAFPNGLTGTTGWTGLSNNFAYFNSFGYATRRFYSLYANAAYTYSGKYTLSGSYRTDASNLIAKDPKYRFSPFYSAGLGYEIGKEKFMQDISWLNRLNLRATYGRTGNVDNSTSPFVLLGINPGPDFYTNLPIGRIASKGNPTLTWEKTATLNLGLDYAVLDHKLYGKIDFYQKKGNDLLANIAIPSYTGSTSSKFNNAAMLNRGIELTLGASLPLKGNDIIWTGNFTGAYNKSKITKLFNPNFNANALAIGGSFAYREGYDPSTYWAYQYAGLVNGKSAIVGPNGTFLPMNSFLTDDGRSYMQNVGTTNPRYIFGLSNSFKVYDFNLSFITTAKLGAVFKSQGFEYNSSAFLVLPNRQLSSVLNGDPAKILTLPSDPNDATYSGWGNTFRYLNYNYLSANLARLQELSISYNLPQSVRSKFKIKGAQLIVQGNNLYTWLANNRGEDPEYLFGSLKPRAQYTFGINVKL
jgi:TonB-linked SusC/RagA family outer membrane protein